MDKIITEIFCFVDEFCKVFETELQKISLETGRIKQKPTNTPHLAISEIMTILIMYNFSYSKNFKYYYLKFVSQSAFPNLVSYNRFI